MGCKTSKQIETVEKSVPNKDGEIKKSEEATSNGEQATHGSATQEATTTNEAIDNGGQAVESKTTEQTTASDDAIVTDA